MAPWDPPRSTTACTTQRKGDPWHPGIPLDTQLHVLQKERGEPWHPGIPLDPPLHVLTYPPVVSTVPTQIQQSVHLDAILKELDGFDDGGKMCNVL